MSGKDIICIIIAYLAGGICTGYYLVRFCRKTDIRDYGSGGAGARNVGRLLGHAGFAVTVAGDALKGALVIVMARSFEVAAPAVSLVAVAVVVGHIWPLPLQFRGGKGVATAIGACLAYDPLLALMLLGLTLLLMIFRRGFTLSGLAAFLLLPFAAHALHMPGHTEAALAALATIILFAHRERIRRTMGNALAQREV